MPKHVLLAALGDHPAVISNAVKALRTQAGIPISRLHLLFPDEREDYIGEIGAAMVKEHLESLPDHPVAVQNVNLPFADADSVKNSVAFLRKLTGILREYQRHADADEWRAHLLIAGGRKNMAALMALATQYFPIVVGMYHLLDDREGTEDAAFQSLEGVRVGYPGTEEKIRKALDQPFDGHIKLVSIGFPGAVASLDDLEQAVSHMSGKTASPARLRLSPEARRFYQDVLANKDVALPGLDVWLTGTAIAQWQEAKPEIRREYTALMTEMTDVEWLQGSSLLRTYRMIGLAGSEQRAAFVTAPHDLRFYGDKDVTQAIVCAFAVDKGKHEYVPSEKQLARLVDADKKPLKRLVDIRSNDRTLIVPLGRSPMVATQTCALLERSKAEGEPQVCAVALVYPGDDILVERDVEMLTELFDRRGIKDVVPFPLKGYDDLDSDAACSAYLQTLRTAIRKMQTDHPHDTISLSLSGGRKGMSALALFAAQCEGIDKIYHTLITDPGLAEDVEKETNRKVLKELDDEERERRLFLEKYAGSIDKFVLFPIPIIPFAAEG